MKLLDLRSSAIPELNWALNDKKTLKTLLKQQLEAFLGTPKKGLKPSLEDLEVVSDIIETVQNEGDKALRKYALLFDNYNPSTASNPADNTPADSTPLDSTLAGSTPRRSDFLVTDEEFETAKNQVSEALKNTLKAASDNIFAYHKNQVAPDWSFSHSEGVVLGQRIRPLERVALYIPGGKAAYPSTVLMNGIPALIAGVEEIAIFTPPDKSGKVNPLVLYAADLLGIREVYKLGGAQAIAAAAYGTETISTVDKIVGPGNRYVALAKKLVFGDVAIDMIAGPSEVLILADESANPQWIAADLLAQAEHDEDASVYLVTTDPSLLPKVEWALEEQLRSLPKSDIARKSIENNGYVFLIGEAEIGLMLSNLIAPEHLELMIQDPFAALEQVEHAGSVFLGANTPEALGDYYAGTNHTLPTSGTARFSSPLGVYDFIKRPSFLSYSKEALEAIGSQVEIFAQAEGLEAHMRSVTCRITPCSSSTPNFDSYRD